MAKLTTASIKKILNKSIGKYNWKRVTKRKFNYNDVKIKTEDDGIISINGKLNWRAYMDYEETEPVFIIDDGENILLMEEESMLPASCFNFFIFNAEEEKKSSGRLGFFVNYKPEFEDAFNEDLNLFPDDIREYTILGLEDLFVKNNLHLCCDQENTFSMYELNKQKVEEKISSLKEMIAKNIDSSSSIKNVAFSNPKEMTSTDENKEKLRKILKDFGFTETDESF